MGEDETLPRNRVALICQKCRLVNGQAPPGTKTLADLGKWRCFGCGTMNGEEDEAVKVVQEMKERIESQEKDAPESENKGAEDSATGESGDMMEGSTDEVDVDSTEDTIEVKPTPSKRGRPKGSKKKA
jgi:endoplasmic reticulum junction formation protein lunapark